MAKVVRLPRLLTVGLLTLLSALTAWSATLSWRVLCLDPQTWLGPGITLTLVVVVVSIVLRLLPVRWASWTGWLGVLAAQVTLGLATISWYLVGTPVPTGARFSLLIDAIGHAIDLSARVKPPAPVQGGVAPLLLLGLLAALIAVDLTVVALQRPSVAGALIVAIWSVTFWDGAVHLPWWQIAAPAATFCLLLLTSRAIDRLAATTDPDRRVRLEPGGALPFFSRSTAIGATAIGVAILVPHIVPTTGLPLFGGGGGGGARTETLQVTNPMVSLKRDLVQGPDDEMIRMRTDDPNPSYLRISVLTRFRDNAWTAGERTVPSSNQAHGQLSLPTGVSDQVVQDAPTYSYDLSATDSFSSRWLPTQPLLTSIEAAGDWRYDTSTMDFLSADKGQTTQRLGWTMTSIKPDYSASYLDSLTSTSFTGQVFTQIPRSLPDSVRSLAREVTAAAQSPFAKAVALQDWFRTDGGFVYDTQTDLGDGADDLVTFLGNGPKSREGFCQHFATAMAVMARTLGIPARVAVGFLRPDYVGDDTWVYSAHDLHAWPELYFAGAGWVRFEPTPAVRAAQAPGYTDISGINRPSQQPTTVPSRRPSSGPTSRPTRAPQSDNTTSDTAPGSGGLSTRTVLTVVLSGAGLLAVALALTPLVVRRQRRHTRLARAGAEDLWDEVRDTAIDLGAPWPDDASVRRQGATLALERTPSAEALQRLMLGVEESRYAPPPRSAGSPSASAPEDARAVTAALWDAAGPRARRRAWTLPASWRRQRR